jgi:mono/diheme cytochrome c family protein
VAFDDLSCTSCHRVVGDASRQHIVAANPGPDLGGGHATQTAEQLAASIVAPSHEIADDVKPRLEGSLSPMGDYSHVMTVRQLADLVAYIRSLE